MKDLSYHIHYISSILDFTLNASFSSYNLGGHEPLCKILGTLSGHWLYNVKSLDLLLLLLFIIFYVNAWILIFCLLNKNVFFVKFPEQNSSAFLEIHQFAFISESEIRRQMTMSAHLRTERGYIWRGNNNTSKGSQFQPCINWMEEFHMQGI